MDVDSEVTHADDKRQRQQPWADKAYVTQMGDLVKERENGTLWKSIPQGHAAEQPFDGESPPRSAKRTTMSGMDVGNPQPSPSGCSGACDEDTLLLIAKLQAKLGKRKRNEEILQAQLLFNKTQLTKLENVIERTKMQRKVAEQDRKAAEKAREVAEAQCEEMARQVLASQSQDKRDGQEVAQAAADVSVSLDNERVYDTGIEFEATQGPRTDDGESTQTKFVHHDLATGDKGQGHERKCSDGASAEGPQGEVATRRMRELTWKDKQEAATFQHPWYISFDHSKDEAEKKWKQCLEDCDGDRGKARERFVAKIVAKPEYTFEPGKIPVPSTPMLETLEKEFNMSSFTKEQLQDAEKKHPDVKKWVEDMRCYLSALVAWEYVDTKKIAISAFVPTEGRGCIGNGNTKPDCVYKYFMFQDFLVGLFQETSRKPRMKVKVNFRVDVPFEDLKNLPQCGNDKTNRRNYMVDVAFKERIDSLALDNVIEKYKHEYTPEQQLIMGLVLLLAKNHVNK